MGVYFFSIFHVQDTVRRHGFRFIPERDLENEEIEAHMKVLKERMALWEDRIKESEEEYVQGTRAHPCVKSQKHYDSLLQAQLEKVSAETEMKLHQLAVEQLSRDSASVDSSLSAEEEHENQLRMLITGGKINVAQSRIEFSEVQMDSDGRWRDCCADFDSKRFLREVYHYTAFTGLLDFANKSVFTHGVTQVSLLFPNRVAASHD